MSEITDRVTGPGKETEVIAVRGHAEWIRGGDWGSLYARARPRNLPAPLHDEWVWQLQGKCRDYSVDVFFPDARGKRLESCEARAKSICRACPVVGTCREYALRAPEAYGIWGALTPRERAHLLTVGLPPT